MERTKYIWNLRILEIVNWGNDFVGNRSLADARRIMDEEEGEEVLSSLILETLSISRLDLKVLVLSKGMQFKPSDVWKLVMQCPNLESLHMRFNLIPEDGEDGLPSVPVKLNIPKEIKPLNKLKSFFWKCEDHWINWESMAEWMGSGLEDLTIHGAFGIYSREKSLFPSPKHLFSMTRVCFSNLRSIHLIGVHSKVPYSPRPEEKISESFPNLESITLDKVDDWTYSFFKNFSYPKLITIWIQDGGSQLTEDPYYNHDDWTYGEPEDSSLQRSFDFLQFVLSACDTSILHSIYFSHKEEMDLEDLDAIHVRLVFSKLEWIQLNGSDAAIEGVGRFIWETSSEFPALIFFGSSQTLWDDFSLKSPLLSIP